MQRTKIEWVRNLDGSQGYSLNPVKGKCPIACSYCYARRLYDRFKWNPEIRYEYNLWRPLIKLPPSRIFVGSTMELFGDWVREEWMRRIFEICRILSQHAIIFLTKQPEELLRWSPFPSNCWIGSSVTNQEMHNKTIACLAGIKASVKFISYEPLLSEINFNGAYDLSEIDWVIIGQQTPVKESTRPKSEWIQEIINASNEANIPIFIKNNILDDWNSHWLGNWNRQEMPKVL